MPRRQSISPAVGRFEELACFAPLTAANYKSQLKHGVADVGIFSRIYSPRNIITPGEAYQHALKSKYCNDSSTPT